MYKKIFYHSLFSGILATIVALIYNRFYFFATEVDFSRIINLGSLAGTSILVCLIAGLLYWALIKSFKKKGEIIFNFLFSILSFASVIIPISVSLPLDIKYPEIFPGLAVPMVFFPAMAWYTLRPLFKH